MAKLWIVYGEGLRLLGAVIGEVDLGRCISTLDIAPWRWFTIAQPESVSLEQVQTSRHRKRALVEVSEKDRYDLCMLPVGFFESPYSPDECLRRVRGKDSAPLETGA
jgi:hypothetical protein